MNSDFRAGPCTVRPGLNTVSQNGTHDPRGAEGHGGASMSRLPSRRACFQGHNPPILRRPYDSGGLNLNDGGVSACEPALESASSPAENTPRSARVGAEGAARHSAPRNCAGVSGSPLLEHSPGSGSAGQIQPSGAGLHTRQAPAWPASPSNRGSKRGFAAC